MKKNLILAAKLLVTVLLIFYLFKTKGIDLQKSWTYIRQSNLLYLFLALMLLMIGQFICTIRWSQILHHLKIRLPLTRLFQFYLIGMFFSLFFPSVIGGDFVKIYYVKRDSGKSLTYALASIYLERAAGFLALLVYGILGALLYPLALTPQDFRPIGWLGLAKIPIWMLPAGVLVLFLAANWVLFGSHLYGGATRLLNWLHLNTLSEKVILIRDAMQSFRRHPSALFWPLVISFINIGMVVVMNWLVGLALDIHLPLTVYAAVVSLMTLLVMLPISINGIGVRENSYVFLLALVGVGPDKSFTLSLVGFFLIVLSGLPGGIVYSMLKKEIPVPSDDQILERNDTDRALTEMPFKD